MRGLAYLLGVAAGLGLTVQVGMNAQLRKVLGSAWSAALVSFLVGTLALVALMLATRTAPPSRETLAAVPAWAWFGGLLGAFYVAISTIVAAELGATSLLVLAVAGQLAMALVVDHFGWLGMPENPITWDAASRGSLAVRGCLAHHALKPNARLRATQRAIHRGLRLCADTSRVPFSCCWRCLLPGLAGAGP